MTSTIALGKYKKDKGVLKKTIELCNGFKNLKPSDKVVIKPNLVSLPQIYLQRIWRGLMPWGIQEVIFVIF